MMNTSVKPVRRYWHHNGDVKHILSPVPGILIPLPAMAPGPAVNGCLKTLREGDCRLPKQGRNMFEDIKKFSITARYFLIATCLYSLPFILLPVLSSVWAGADCAV